MRFHMTTVCIQYSVDHDIVESDWKVQSKIKQAQAMSSVYCLSPLIILHERSRALRCVRQFSFDPSAQHTALSI